MIANGCVFLVRVYHRYFLASGPKPTRQFWPLLTGKDLFNAGNR